MDNKFENLKQKLSKYWSKVGNKYSIITIVVVALLFYLVGVINIKPEVSKLENKYSIVKKENSKLEEEKENSNKEYTILKGDYEKLKEKTKIYTELSNDEKKTIDTKIDELKKAADEEKIAKEKAKQEAEEKAKQEKIAKQEEEKKKYIGIDNTSIKDVKSGMGNNIIGKRGYAEFDENSITEQSLINYYNDYIKDKGYNYYTIVDKSNKNKGIVFPACMPYASYGNIDNTGGITNSDKEIEITDTSVIVTSE
ncbi:MAG: hypothetical protein ACLR02_10500 [Clostridium sp.]|jgi:flagellar biosynthesis GTPase FlhF